MVKMVEGVKEFFGFAENRIHKLKKLKHRLQKTTVQYIYHGRSDKNLEHLPGKFASLTKGHKKVEVARLTHDVCFTVNLFALVDDETSLPGHLVQFGRRVENQGEKLQSIRFR